MALIKNLENTATIEYDGSPISSNTVNTLLEYSPSITKAVDKTIAKIGDILTYTIEIINENLFSLENIPFTDVLPVGSQYVENSFTVDGQPATPTLDAQTLNYTIPIIAEEGTVTITFQVEVIGGEI